MTGTGAFGNVACSGTGSFGSVTVSGAQADISAGGNLTIGGSYGAWALAPLYGTSYGTGNQSVTWAALTTSRNITHTANTNSFQVAQAGTYFISCYVQFNTITTGGFQIIGRYSTNGSTWSNVLASTGAGASLAGVTMSTQGIYTMAASSYADIQIYNATTGTVTLYGTTPLSYFYMYRIG